MMHHLPGGYFIQGSSPLCLGWGAHLGQFKFPAADEDSHEETGTKTSSEPKTPCEPGSRWFCPQHLRLSLEDRQCPAWRAGCVDTYLSKYRSHAWKINANKVSLQTGNPQCHTREPGGLRVVVWGQASLHIKSIPRTSESCSLPWSSVGTNPSFSWKSGGSF